MDKFELSQISISSTTPGLRTPFLSLYFHIYFTAISALFTVFLLRASLLVLTSRAIATFKLQIGSGPARTWRFITFTSQQWLPRSSTSNAYREVPGEDDTTVESYNEQEDIEMGDYASVVSTSNEALQERGINLLLQAQHHTENLSTSTKRRTLSAHIASAFEAYPESISRASLVNTVTINLDDSEKTSRPRPSIQSYFKDTGTSELNLDQCNNFREVEQHNAITKNDDGPSAGLKNNGGPLSFLENVLEPSLDSLVDWIVRATEEEMVQTRERG